MDQHNVATYSEWNSNKLIERVVNLEKQLRDLTEKYEAKRTPAKLPRPKNARRDRVFDPAKYSTRLVALKFAYLGKAYNGFEHHANNKTPLPTVEEALWKAFMKARLIFPSPAASLGPNEVNWEGCEYSKCGRTDKGVSAFGQVIGIRVRSNRPLPKEESSATNSIPSVSTSSMSQAATSDDQGATQASVIEQAPSDDVADEIPYPQILNRVLPPDIRILAWCPHPPPGFSARFSCGERRYRYFFTQPAFVPDPISLSPDRDGGEGWLDIDAMRLAAKKFEGLHDFRNFCKIDPGKQIADFSRRIFLSDVVEVREEDQATALSRDIRLMGDPEERKLSNSTFHKHTSKIAQAPKVYMFVLHGSAFLWHQVRCMVAMLFLIGQGLEPPSLIDNLLDKNITTEKPMYNMAEDTPLVLWDCIFPDRSSKSREDTLNWVYVSDQIAILNGTVHPTGSLKGGKYGSGGLVEDLWKVWRARKMDEILAGSLLNTVVNQGPQSPMSTRFCSEPPLVKSTQKMFFGGDGPERKGAYVPVLKRRRMESVEVQNQKYAKRKGISPRERRDVEDTRGDHQRVAEP